MDIETKPFLYKKRYNHSVGEAIDDLFFKLKYRLQKFILQYKFTAKILHPLEGYMFDRKKKLGRFNIENRLFTDEAIVPYNKVSIIEMNYFEVIEIDDFDKYRKTIISKFGKHQMFRSTKKQNDLKITLSKVKQEIDTISRGQLFSINYDKTQTENNDLISYVNVNYIKTNESYFILQIQVKLSTKFHDIFSEIVSQKDIGLSLNHYNSFIDIIKTKRFHSYESFQSSLKVSNIRNLLFDVNQQVKINITSHLQGHFHQSKKSKFLPSIECYEVENIHDFHLDKNLKDNFKNYFENYYALKDNKIEIYIPDSSDVKQTLIQIIKEKGHGEKNTSEKDKSDYDYLETYYLIHSLAFPCFFTAILSEQFEKLNLLKRQIYDFVNDTKKRNLFKPFLFFYYNNRYINLKQTLTEILLTTKRFETEFTNKNIYWYSDGQDLSEFEPRNKRVIRDNSDLMTKLINDFTYRIKQLEIKTKSINEIFKTIEELNNYRTNFLLQTISLLIAILAFVFTFDKTKILFIKAWEIVRLLF